MRKWHDGLEEVRRLRQGGKSLVEICEATGISKATVYSWIKDLPVPRRVLENINSVALSNLAKGRADTQWKWRGKREQSYRDGLEESEKMLSDRMMRDFICLYLAEGDKKSRGRVGIVNTDPKIIGVADRVLARLTAKPRIYRLFCSMEEKDNLTTFWSDVLGVGREKIIFQEKKKRGRRRAEYGLLSITICETSLKCRLTAWIDRLKEEWNVPVA
jgi:hypothetical protein